MNDSTRLSAVLFVCLSFTAGCLLQLSRHYNDPFLAISSSLESSVSELEDAGAVVLGLRRFGADIAWIQTLQYYGTEESGLSESEIENGLGQYPLFLDYCKRVSDLDPYFTYVYYYGGGVLGWNLNRLGEAEELLKQGIARNPKEYRLAQYLAALAYQKNHDVKNLMVYLESIVQDPDCPLLMKAILANIYKKQHEFIKALHLWLNIYDTGTPVYQQRALEQIQKIQMLMKASRS